MRKLLNTLFVTTENAYASLENENVVLRAEDNVLMRYPLHILEGICLFTYSGASPALMGECAKRGINLSFLTPRGKFLARVTGESKGNVLLRRTQYRIADDEIQSCRIARSFIFGKINNSKNILSRMKRDHAERIDEDAFATAIFQMRDVLGSVLDVNSLDSLRGLEGTASSIYFRRLDDMILRDKDNFFFHERNRRPPKDKVNAMLSFAYVLLASECASALENVGLDAYVGVFHQDRSGRKSLALDLMEELRPCMADRFVLKLINDRIIQADDFVEQQSGAVELKDSARKRFLQEWQEKKHVVITHPYLREKIEWGLLPHVQALLLARYMRGDIDAYPPFLYK